MKAMAYLGGHCGEDMYVPSSPVGEHRTILLLTGILPAYAYFDLSRTYVEVLLVRVFMLMSFYAITHVSKNVPFFTFIFASHLLRFRFWIRTIMS